MIFKNQKVTFDSELAILNVQIDNTSLAYPIYIRDDGVVIQRSSAPDPSQDIIAGGGIEIKDLGSPTITEKEISIKLDDTDPNNLLSIDPSGFLVFDNSIFNDYVEKTGDTMTGALLFNGALNSDNTIGTSGNRTFTIITDSTTRIAINGEIEIHTNFKPDLTGDRSLGLLNKRWSTVWTDNINLRNNTSSYFYIGSEGVDGSWRFFVNSAGELEFQKRESGTWEFKTKMV